MDRDFFKFSMGALGLIAAGLVVFYFLERARYEYPGTVMQEEAQTANISEAVLPR